MNRLLSPDPAEGGDPAAPASPPTPAPAAAAPAPAPAPPVAAPPAASTVVHGTKTEADAQLAAELETTRKQLRDAQTRASELERDVQTLREPVKIPVKKKQSEKVVAFPWMRDAED